MPFIVQTRTCTANRQQIFKMNCNMSKPEITETPTGTNIAVGSRTHQAVRTVKVCWN